MASELTEQWWTQVLAGSGGSLQSDGSDEEYIVLPKPETARIVVDRREEQAVKDAMNRMIDSRTNFGPAKSVLRGASTLVNKRKPSFRVTAGRTGKTLRDHLTDVLETDLRISIAVGPPRPNRKPVIRCYRDDGLFAVAKLGPDSHTAAMVKNEIRWLDAMAGRPLSGIETPPLLHSGEFDGCALLVMGALDLTSDLGVEVDEVPIDTAKEFSARFSEEGSMIDSEWWHRLPVRMNDSQLDSVHAQLAQLAKFSNFESVPVSAWHGDWSPWNMGWSSSGKFCIWDWERAAVGVPTGFDVLHLHYQYGQGLDAADTDLLALGVPESHHNIVKRMYMFELCARHCEAGALLTDRHTKVIDTLASLSR